MSEGAQQPAAMPPVEHRVAALEALLTERGLIPEGFIEQTIHRYETEIGPMNGAKVVARAWADQQYKQRLLADGTAAIAVVRRPLDERRFTTALVGTKRRYAAMAADDRWARRRFVRLADYAGRTVAVDARTGTTTMDSWEPGSGPAAVRDTHSVDEWLTSIAAGQAVGMTSEATVAQYPRPGVVYRPVRDAPPVSVWLAWWRDDPPVHRAALVRLVRDVYLGAADAT